MESSPIAVLLRLNPSAGMARVGKIANSSFGITHYSWGVSCRSKPRQTETTDHTSRFASVRPTPVVFRQGQNNHVSVNCGASSQVIIEKKHATRGGQRGRTASISAFYLLQTIPTQPVTVRIPYCTRRGEGQRGWRLGRRGEDGVARAVVWVLVLVRFLPLFRYRFVLIDNCSLRCSRNFIFFSFICSQFIIHNTYFSAEFGGPADML